MSDDRKNLPGLNGNGKGPPPPKSPVSTAGSGDGADRHPFTQQEGKMNDHPRFHSNFQPVGPVTGPNDAAWIEAYIDRADEPIDFSPVKRRIRNRKLTAIEAETLSGEKAATEIVARTAPFVPLPPVRDPWEDTADEN